MMNDTSMQLTLYMLTEQINICPIYKANQRKMMMININLFGQLENKWKSRLNCKRKYLKTMVKEKEESNFLQRMIKANQIFPLQL